MPMPKPKTGESKSDFISRFMSDPIMIDEYPEEKQRRAIAEEQFKGKENKLFTIDEVEIFETGKWNNDDYTIKDLDDIVEAFSETRSALKPHVKLGHSNNQVLLQRDGFPAAGWITDLRRKGSKLVAKVENIPEKIYSLIQSKAYGRISSEIYWNLKLNGKKYRRALKAIALLGADTPEVHSLNDFIALYTENFDGELKIYETKEKEFRMDNEKLYELENQLKEYKSKLDDLEKKYQEALNENTELKDYAAKVEYDKKLSEIRNYLDSQVQAGKITPAQVDYFSAIALDDKELKTYTNQDNHKIEGKSFDIVKSIIESGAKQVDFSQQTQHVEPERKPVKADNADDKLHSRITEYMKEHKVSYQDAFDIISYEEV